MLEVSDIQLTRTSTYNSFRQVIRYSMLVNPTRSPGKFCSPDWCMKLNNLYTKVHSKMTIISNYTLKTH